MHSMWDEGGHSRCYLTHVPLTSDNRHSSDIFCQVINLNRGLLREEEICTPARDVRLQSACFVDAIM